jgi:hypothetical protein
MMSEGKKLRPIDCNECCEILIDCEECGMLTGTCTRCGTHFCCDCDDCHGEVVYEEGK